MSHTNGGMAVRAPTTFEFDMLSDFEVDTTIAQFTNLLTNPDLNSNNVTDQKTVVNEPSNVQESTETLEPCDYSSKGDDESGSESSSADPEEEMTGSPETADTEAPAIGTPTKVTKPTKTSEAEEPSKAMFIPHSAVTPINDDEMDLLEVGILHMNGTSRVGKKTAKVYQVWTRFEQFLSDVETRTPNGTRYLLRHPDTMFPESDDHETRLSSDTAQWTSVQPDSAASTNEVFNGPASPENSGWVSVLRAPVSIPADVDFCQSPAEEEAKEKMQPYQEFYEIRPSEKAGLGAFAVRDIEEDQVILVEEPILRTTPFLLRNDLAELPRVKKEAFMSLAYNPEVNRFAVVEDIWHKNSFAVPCGIAIFAIASRFNHACDPVCNVTYAWDNDKNVMTFVTTRAIKAGEELTITYGGRPIDLYVRYGFVCKCGGCQSMTDEEVRRYEHQMW